MADLRVVTGNRNAPSAKRNAGNCLCAKPDIGRLGRPNRSAEIGADSIACVSIRRFVSVAAIR